jgi:hypothetical protein
MTLFEYLAQPEHPWFNTNDYTTTQVTLFTIGALLWCAAYVQTIRMLFCIEKSKRALDIPIVAVLLNFGCEITTAFFFVPNMGLVLVFAYWAWMLLDIFIFIGLFKYGRDQMVFFELKKNFPLYIFSGFITSFFVQYFFITQYDLPMAPLDSYAINLVMSMAFISLMFVKGYKGNSSFVAWTKFFGTGIISVMFYSKYPENNFLTSLYIFCALFDVVYLYLLYSKKYKII